MRIVHVEDFFHPDAGYQVNLLSRLQNADGHDVFVVTAELEKVPSFITDFFGKDAIDAKDRVFEKETGVQILRVPLIGYYSGRAIFYPRIFSLIRSLRPDVVFVHGEDTVSGIMFILCSGWLSYPIVLDCHMLEMASLNRFREYFRAFYRVFVTPIILKNKIPLIRVVDSNYVQKCLGIPLDHTDLLSFGTDTSYFCPNLETRKSVRTRYGIKDDTFLVIYAGKLDETKGGLFLAAAIRRAFRFNDSHRRIEFLIIGNCEGEYGSSVEMALQESENKVHRLPTQRYYDLANFYQAADLAVFPRQCSMSFFEAQSCGLPVLFEDNEINQQRASYNNAYLFEPGNIEDFRKNIISLSSLPDGSYSRIGESARNYVVANYNYVPIARKFNEVLQRAVTAWNARLSR